MKALPERTFDLLVLDFLRLECSQYPVCRGVCELWTQYAQIEISTVCRRIAGVRDTTNNLFKHLL